VVISLTEVVKDYASDPFHLANDYVVTLISTAGLRLERQPALFCLQWPIRNTVKQFTVCPLIGPCAHIIGVEDLDGTPARMGLRGRGTKY
jgi:hypothetical protein